MTIRRGRPRTEEEREEDLTTVCFRADRETREAIAELLAGATGLTTQSAVIRRAIVAAAEARRAEKGQKR